jgi:hypothetical protein
MPTEYIFKPLWDRVRWSVALLALVEAMGLSLPNSVQAQTPDRILMATPSPELPIFMCVDAKGRRSFTNVESERKNRACELQTSTWRYVGIGDGVRAYIVSESLAKTGSKWKFWVLYSYEQGQRIDSLPVSKIFRSAKVLTYVDCSARTLSSVHSAYYSNDNGSGTNIYATAVDPSQAPFVDPVPGSAGELILQSACMSIHAAQK